MKLKFIYMLLIAVIMGCGNAITTETMWVNSYKAKCVGVAPMNCLLVKKAEDASWENFYDSIADFDYVPGYIYKLEVEVTENDKANTPADKSIYSYKLIKVISKEIDRSLRINDIWVASNIEGMLIEQSKNQPRLEISVQNMQLQGTDGCNSIRAKVNALTENAISIGPAMGTRKMCIDMEVPTAFNAALQKVSTYQIKDNKLFMYDDSNTQILEFFKID